MSWHKITPLFKATLRVRSSDKFKDSPNVFSIHCETCCSKSLSLSDFASILRASERMRKSLRLLSNIVQRQSLRLCELCVTDQIPTVKQSAILCFNTSSSVDDFFLLYLPSLHQSQ